MAPLQRVARALTVSLAGLTALGLVAVPASADPGHGKAVPGADKAAKEAAKQAQKQAEQAQKQAEKAAKDAAKAVRDATRAAQKQAGLTAKGSPVIVLPPVQVPVPATVAVPPVTVAVAVPPVVPPVTANARRAERCARDQAKLVLRRSQLEMQANALTVAEAAARGAGRIYEADYLRVEIARVQKELARTANDLQKKQADCVGIPVPAVTPVSVLPVAVLPAIQPVSVPVTVPATIARPRCAGAHGQRNAMLRQIRTASRHAARAQAESFRARSRGETAKADAKLAEATRHQQRVTLLMARRAALATACPAAA